jgi:predicted MPP superfamily phosphohydrolase
VQRIVDRVNGLEADAMAITGDIVDGPVQELRTHVAPLGNLRSRHGTFFVTGNHEYYAGAGPWLAEVRGLGIRVLMNEHVVLRARRRVAGAGGRGRLHRPPLRRDAPQRSGRGTRGRAGQRRRVLLAHQPRTAAAAAEAGFDLQISGHTHGGQFLPWTFFVRFQQPYTAGLHQLGRLWVYVSRGTGYWGPPKRLGAPSEISELRAAWRRPS